MNQDNLLLKTDSYKASHYQQYKPGTTKIYSYLESRGGRFDETLFFGLQYILKRHLEKPVTMADIDEADEFWNQHFGKRLFNREGWEYIVKQHGGKLPVRIKAVKEGSIVPTRNVLMTIENTDDKCWWLTNFLETILMQVWYPITIATHSYECKKVIRQYLKETGDVNLIGFKLHDFGFRGASSWETSAIGAASHLVSFMGTDTVSGIILLKNYYNADMCGFSIPASEHSTITSWGKEHEVDAYKNMLIQYTNGLVACVSDSFDIYNACDKLWGEMLHDDIIKRNGTLVIRPDSGNPIEVNSKLIDILWNKFGGDYNDKGYKVLNSHVRIIQGDGIDLNMIKEILQLYKTKGYSADNIAFGCGGALLQKFDRDTQKFAIKCSMAVIDGKEVNVNKEPVTQIDKSSKKGRLKLHLTGDKWMTVSSANETPSEFNGYKDELEDVFVSGEIKRIQTLNEIKKIASK